jgi:hypothetical protein
MKILAIGSGIKPMSDEQRMQIMPKEVPDTLRLYLDGKIEQFWFREDKPGVVFIMNAESVEQAKATTDAMPLVVEGFLSYEFMALGPLKPLGMLLQGK